MCRTKQSSRYIITVKLDIKIVQLVSAILLVYLGASIHVKASEVLTLQPNCIHAMTEAVETIKKLKVIDGVLTKDGYGDIRKIAIENLVNRAVSEGFDAVVITGIKTKSQSDQIRGRQASERFILEASANFINLCPDDKTLSEELTKYNSDGALQLGKSAPYKLKNSIEFKAASLEIVKPELVSNLVLSQGSLYGLELMSSSRQTIEYFGTPSMVFHFNEFNKVLAYGRSHLLYYVKDKLVKAASRIGTAHPFTYELNNILPFDERFDDSMWSINGSINKNDESKEIGVLDKLESNANTIKLVWSDYKNKRRKLVGFELFNEMATEFDKTFSGNADTSSFDWMQAIEERALDAEVMIQNSKGVLSVNSRRKRYLLNDRLVFDVVGKQVKRIVIGDPLYIGSNSDSNKIWQFGDYYKGQNIEPVLENIPDNANSLEVLNDEVHVSYDNYDVVLFTYEKEIYQLEVKLY